MFGTDVITNEKHPSTSATGVGVGWGLTQPVARGERRGSTVHVTSPIAPSHVIFVSEGGGGMITSVVCVLIIKGKTCSLRQDSDEKKVKSKHYRK